MNDFIIMREDFVRLQQNLVQISETLDQLKQKKETGLSEKWLDSSEVCQLLNISKRTLCNLRSNRVIGSTKVGSKVYYKSSEIESILNENFVVSKLNSKKGYEKA